MKKGKHVKERIDVKTAAKIAFFCGEINTNVFQLLCDDTNIDYENIRLRKKEIREAMTARTHILVSGRKYEKERGDPKSIMYATIYSTYRPTYESDFLALMSDETQIKDEDNLNEYIEAARYRRYTRESKETDQGKIKNKQAQERRLHVGEIMAMMYRAGIQIGSELTMKNKPLPRTRSGVDAPIFIRTTDIQLANDEDREHIKLTRMHGVLYTKDASYTLYNIGNGQSNLKYGGETKYKYLLSRTQPKGRPVENLILVGRDSTNDKCETEHLKPALEFIKQSVRITDLPEKFVKTATDLYRNIYYIPETTNGMRQLRILAVPQYWERICASLGIVPVKYENHDALGGDGTHSCNMLTGNLTAFMRIVTSYMRENYSRRIYIFDWQEQFMREAIRYIGIHNPCSNYYSPMDIKPFRYTVIKMQDVEKVLRLPPLPPMYRCHE